MGFYETEYWLNDSWDDSRKERQSGAYHPYTPDLIVGKEFAFSGAALDSGAEAQARIGELHTAGLRTESIDRILLRLEALSSSRIEGLELPMEKLLVAEELRRMGVVQRPGSVAAMVLGNTDTMLEAIGIACSGEAIGVGTFLRMHRLLMRGTRAESIGGVVRTTQNWIGGNRTNPIGAAYVPPQPEKVRALLEDLAEFCNTSEYPPFVTAAIAHAQFETIHPFDDGNGRTGRALVHALAGSRGGVLPISLVLMADKERYVGHLRAYHSDADGQGGSAVDSWVSYFAQALASACARATELDEVLEGVRGQWRDRVRFGRGSAGERILQILPSHPVLTVARAAEVTGSSDEACRVAIGSMVDAGVLVQNAKNRKSGLYVAHDVIDALTAFERTSSAR